MIFYFSGTGNTRWAAEHLAAATGERLLFIPEELKGDCRYTLAAGERIGFCFPTHGWQPPRIVRQFIRRLFLRGQGSMVKGQGLMDKGQLSAQACSLDPSSPRPQDASTPRRTLRSTQRDTPHLENSHYCYALTTCGDSIGRTMEILNKELAAVGLKASSVFSLTMPESYVCLPFMKTDKPERECEKIAVATRELEQYTDLIVRRVPDVTHTHRGLTPWTFSHVIGAYFNARMITDKPFTVDADRCIHCGQCAKACPTGDVTMKPSQDGAVLPQWHHDGSCTNCLACYHHCPCHAINYGRITRQRGQYYFGHGNSYN